MAGVFLDAREWKGEGQLVVPVLGSHFRGGFEFCNLFVGLPGQLLGHCLRQDAGLGGLLL